MGGDEECPFSDVTWQSLEEGYGERSLECGVSAVLVLAWGAKSVLCSLKLCGIIN